MARRVFTILGCGSSGGVPRLGGHWGACDPSEPKNRRQRCSLLVQQFDAGGVTNVLIDTSPDLRNQLLAADIGQLDGVVYTHDHADHTHGLDDLRMIVFNMRKRVPVWADEATQRTLVSRFGYAFVQPEGSLYKPILEMQNLNGPVTICGPGGEITFEPFPVQHGGIIAKGFRIGGLAYLPDVSEMTDEGWDAVDNLDYWILDALRRDPHPTHIHLEKALEWIERVQPKQAVLTNMHIDLDYKTLSDETADHIAVAYDGMQIKHDI
ncbi:MAG: MBL fold metallo-hydrolase [Rhodobacteraceae bacterium]|nr:MBL fold metallo-hydrolase [Paracoccaceae bacterium]